MYGPKSKPLHKRNTLTYAQAEAIWQRVMQKRNIKRVTLQDGPFKGRQWWFAGGEAVPVSAWCRAGTWIGEYSAEGKWTGDLVAHPAPKAKRKRKGKKKDGTESVIVKSKG
jgi:hypothetical protein